MPPFIVFERFLTSSSFPRKFTLRNSIQFPSSSPLSMWYIMDRCVSSDSSEKFNNFIRTMTHSFPTKNVIFMLPKRIIFNAKFGEFILSSFGTGEKGRGDDAHSSHFRNRFFDFRVGGNGV